MFDLTGMHEEVLEQHVVFQESSRKVLQRKLCSRKVSESFGEKGGIGQHDSVPPEGASAGLKLSDEARYRVHHCLHPSSVFLIFECF